jgi:hydroxyethylthiazole kinase-like sugar kinase family protein
MGAATSISPSHHRFVAFLQAHSIAEVEAFVSIASALLINVGTLSDGWVGGMKLGAQRAVELSKPWVLDPVGCGATPYRSLVRGGSGAADSCTTA